MRETLTTAEEVLSYLMAIANGDERWGDDLDMESLRFALKVVIPVFTEHVERTRPNSRPTWP